MQYQRCKCGSLQFWGSGMGAPACSFCEKCQTTPAYSPNGHSSERPTHEFIETKVETDDGSKPLSRCKHCMKTRAQIEGNSK